MNQDSLFYETPISATNNPGHNKNGFITIEDSVQGIHLN